MTKLEWNRSGERFFQTGVDQGVLFVEDVPVGIPWNGLASVREGSTGGEATGVYIDGIRVNQETSLEEFVGTIEAYMYPDEFEACQGESHPEDSLLGISQQPRKSFAIAYRTRVGNDVMGTDFAYKIHLVFGLTAQPSKRSHATLDSNTDVKPLAWDVESIAEAVPGYLATSHLVFESNKLYQVKLEQLEGIIFGTEDTDARLPTPEEIIEILRWYNPVWIHENTLTAPRDNMASNPEPTVYGGSGWANTGGFTPGEDDWLNVNYQGANTTAYLFSTGADEAVAIGDPITIAIDYRVDRVEGAATHMRMTPHMRAGNRYYNQFMVTEPIILGLVRRTVIQFNATEAFDLNQLDIAIVTAIDGGFGAVSGITWAFRHPVIHRGFTDGVYPSLDSPESIFSTLPGYHYHEILGIRDPRLPGDINEVSAGLFERTATTRLVESVTEGLYRLEA